MMQRHHHCRNLSDFGISNVVSCSNNQSVYAVLFDASQDGLVWSICPGGSSSNATSLTDEHFVCTR
ncbi:hypothetical protein [Streptomyces sp. NPDC001604]|uniref:hypothetical protein n=1 Tax=Streptomyces sp. NPDC001604 TaxID=3364593 RepID=UPI0036C316FE